MKLAKRILCISLIVISILAFIALAAVLNWKEIEYYFSYEYSQDWHMDYGSPIHVFNGLENVAHVKFVELQHNISHTKRSEYVFEVVDWLKGGNNEKTISAYSSKHKGKAWGTLELYEYCKYEEGKEYIVYLYIEDGVYKISRYIYCPLDDYKNVSSFDYLSMYKLLVEDDGMPEDLTKEEFIEYVRYLSTKHYATRDEFKAELKKYLDDPTTYYPFADDGTALAHARLLEQKINADDEERYYEYRFEVIEWLRNSYNETVITVYLEKNFGDLNSRRVFKEYEGRDYQIEYKNDSIYIIKLQKEGSEYRLCYELFCKLLEQNYFDLGYTCLSNYIDTYWYIQYVAETEEYPGIPSEKLKDTALINKIKELCTQKMPVTE